MRQKDGDSTRRQLQLAREYAENNNLALQDTTIEDLGVSAFRGRNNREGALGGFLEAVKSGHIESDSWLLVESVDRLSRQTVEDAYQLISGILALGITIVTLQDEQVYQQGQLDLGKLMLLLVKAQTAYEESQKKSLRTGAAWDAARADLANGKKIKNAMIPSWLSWNDDKTDFVIKEEVAKTVRYIFELSLQGFGSGVIAKRLTSENRLMLNGKPSNWSAANVNSVQNNRTVIGEFTPMKKNPETGKRKPISDPIPDYYPLLVKPEQFYEVQRQLASRKRNSGSYQRGEIVNLFTGLIKCGYCGSAMIVHQKNKKADVEKYGRYEYLNCSRKTEKSCTSKPLNYRKLERLLVSSFTFLPSILDGNQNSNTQLSDARLEVIRLEQSKKEIQDKSDRLMAVLMERDSNELLLKQLDKLTEEQKSIDNDLKHAIANVEKLTGTLTYTDSKYNDIFTELNSVEAMSDVDWRMRFNTQLRRILDQIIVTTDDCFCDDGVSIVCFDKQDNLIAVLYGQRSLPKLYGVSNDYDIYFVASDDGSAPIDLVGTNAPRDDFAKEKSEEEINQKLLDDILKIAKMTYVLH